MKFWHLHFADKPNERPAFTQMVEQEQPTINGYTLRVDLEKNTASIIKSNKGGQDSMLKQEVKAIAGYEEIFEKLTEKKANLESDKEKAKAEAIAKVEADFAENEQRVDNMLKEISVVEEVEVPDEQPETETAEEEVKTEETGISF